MRLFVALFPPKEYLDYLREVSRSLNKHKRNLKFTPTDQLHITLKFVGSSVSTQSYEIIRDLLISNVKTFGAVDVEISGVSFGFPKERFPKILIAKIKSTQSLINLSDNVHLMIQDLKLKDTIRRKNRYASNFHVSIARLKDNATKSTASNLKSDVKNINIPLPPRIKLTEMYLVESNLSPKGPVYKKLERIEL